MEALEAHGGVKARAALSLGLPENTYRHRLKLAVKHGHMGPPPAPPNPPEGMTPTGVSILSNSDGEIQRWEKFKAEDYNRQALIEETLRVFMEPLRGLAKPTKAPKTTGGDYMVGLPIGDCHIGLLAWGQETGHGDWDSDKAEAAICQSMDEIIDAAPATDECWIWQLGDFLHVDNDAGTTTAGTPQDMDTRFPKIVRTGIRTLRYITEKALSKYGTVNLRNAKGNHDGTAVLTLNESFRAFYENEPRLVVHDSPRDVFIHRWGANLFAVTHGHKPKPDKVPPLLATDGIEDWAQSKRRYVHHGHYHEKSLKVFQQMGVEVECHAAPTAPDSWTISQGYRSTRELKSILYHVDGGEKQRFISQITGGK